MCRGEDKTDKGKINVGKGKKQAQSAPRPEAVRRFKAPGEKDGWKSQNREELAYGEAPKRGVRRRMDKWFRPWGGMSDSA